jgi:alpha-ribazole phosphatase
VRLILVRHAEPADHARGRCYGTLEVPLSDRGREQAAALADRLRGEPIDAVYASPRTRARETAAALGLPVEVDDRLREIDFGAFEGRTYEEIERDHPDIYAHWMRSPTTVRFPGGESYADLRARVVPALDEIRTRHEHALVVTHGGVVRAAVAAWLELPDHAVFRLAIDYCRLTVVEWQGDEPLVRAVNG